MLKRGILLACFIILSLLGCNNSSQSSSSISQISKSDTSSFISESLISSSSKPVYQKDEQGFFILEDGYFHIDEPKETEMLSPIAIADVKYANNYRLFFGDQQIPVYGCNTNPGRAWVANPTVFIEAGVATINLKGKGIFKLQTNFAFKNSTEISPLSENIEHEYDLDRRVVTFEIDGPGQYTISFLKNLTFHLFVNPIEEEVIPSGTNVIRFPSGVHTKANNKLIGSNNLVTLSSNTTVVLERGAIVEAGFIASSKSNIHIMGDGIILGSHFERDPNKGSKLIPIEFSYCNNISIKGITCLDPAGWCYNLYFDTNVLLDNIKIISSRSNGDGVSVQSCKDLVCKRSFVRSWDDSLVVKNYKSWKTGEQGSTSNITFSKCQIWTDLAQCMEIGYETVGEELKDVYFEDITVLYAYHKPVISIHNSNNAKVRNIHYDRITIENAKMGLGDGNNYLIDFNNNYSSTWSDQYGSFPLGNIENVFINNVLVLKGNADCKVKITGCKDSRKGFDNDEEHYVKNVQIFNIKIIDQYLNNSSDNLLIGDYVYDLSISSDGNIVPADASF